MEYRFLGRSGLKVSAFSFGVMTFAGTEHWSHIGDTKGEIAKRQIDMCVDAGINLFDTADVYSHGDSEVVLAEALGKRRAEVLVATKFAGATGAGVNDRGGSRHHIIGACEASLKRLKTDYIDLYQIHSQDLVTPPEETLRALDDLVRSGKVRYIGASNFTGWQVADADHLARREGLNRFTSAQNEYSLLKRGVEAELLPACEHFGLGLLPYFPLASGLLTGKYRRGEAPPEGSRMATMGWAAKSLTDDNFARVEALDAWAGERGHSLLELAFAWLLAHAPVSSVIAGATRPQQVQANAKAAAWTLTAEDLAAIDAVGV